MSAGRSLEERFWEKVDKRDGGCWLWTAYTNADGYGQVAAGGRTRYAHRVSYQMAVGPIATGLVLDHLCRTPSCVNPGHLEPVPQRLNVLRGESPTAAHAAKTTCHEGHPFNELNTRVNRFGARICRACRRDKAVEPTPCPTCGLTITRSNLRRHEIAIHGVAS